MKTYEEIEKRRSELENEMAKVGYTEAILTEWNALYDEEMMLNKANAIAVAENDNVIIFLEDVYECGWAINKKGNGEWHYNEIRTLANALKEFKESAIANGIEKVLIQPIYLDIDYVKEKDANDAKYEAEEERYTRSATNGDYSPSNPWDAPGMKISDFIKGVY